MDRDYLEGLPRKELQSLAKQHGVKATLASSRLIDELIAMVPATEPTTAPEKETSESPDIAMEVGSQSETVSDGLNLVVGSSCEALVDSDWLPAEIVRINKKTIRVRFGDKESTLKNEEVRAAAPQKVTLAEAEGAEELAYAGLNVSMQEYKSARVSELEPEAIDWLAACCNDDEPVQPTKPNNRGKNITASMHATALRAPWNSTTKVESITRSSNVRPSTSACPRTSTCTSARTSVAAKPRKSSVAAAVPTTNTMNVEVEELQVNAATSATAVVSLTAPAAKRKSFSSAAGKDPTKSAPAIVPRLNKAAQLMIEARRKKLEEEKAEMARIKAETDGPNPFAFAAFSHGTVSAAAAAHAPAPKFPTTSRKMSIMPVHGRTHAASSSAASSSSSSSTLATTNQLASASFKARPMPNFAHLQKQLPVRDCGVDTKENKAAQHAVSTKAITGMDPAAKKAEKLNKFMAAGKDKRASIMSARRGPSSATASAAASVIAPALAPVPVLEPVLASMSVPALVPVGIHGPFSSLLK